MLVAQHPAVVGHVLNHRPQAHELRARGERRDPMGRVRRLEVDPTDHAGHEWLLFGELEQETGLRLRRRRLHQHRALDARRPG